MAVENCVANTEGIYCWLNLIIKLKLKNFLFFNNDIWLSVDLTLFESSFYITVELRNWAFQELHSASSMLNKHALDITFFLLSIFVWTSFVWSPKSAVWKRNCHGIHYIRSNLVEMICILIQEAFSVVEKDKWRTNSYWIACNFFLCVLWHWIMSVIYCPFT